ncbi:hypothetical protein TNCV_757861 [Trichonephila clavipes]|nr:hypothetical protein TNCV_757861 [Trichonephila clavipes]
MKLNPKNERPIKVVLKGLPRNFKVEEIQADLEELGFTLKNQPQKELKIYSNDTWNARLEALNTTDNSLWEAQRFLKNKRSQIPTLNCATGMAVTDPQKANLLANTIKNNFIENNRMQDNYDQDDEVVTSAVNTFFSLPPSTQIEPVMPDEIINFIKNTSSKKAPSRYPKIDCHPLSSHFSQQDVEHPPSIETVTTEVVTPKRSPYNA